MIAILAGFVLWNSSYYVKQMFIFGRVSDMGRVPMWIPHGAVALGFGLIAFVACLRLVPDFDRTPGGRRQIRPGASEAMSFALGVVPVILLLLGFPIFIVLLLVGQRRAGVLHAHAARGSASEPVRIDQRLCAAGDSVLRLCRRTDGARQRGPATGRFRSRRRRFGARQPCRHHRRHVGDLRRDLRGKRGLCRHHRPHHVSGDAARRLSGTLRRRAGYRGRRDRHHHPAQHSDDRLRRVGGRIGAAALCGRRGAGPDAGAHAHRLCHVVRVAQQNRRRRGVQVSIDFCAARRAASGRSACRSSFLAASMAACSRRPKRRRSPASMPLSSPASYSASSAGAISSRPPPSPCCSRRRSSSSSPAPGCSPGC